MADQIVLEDEDVIREETRTFVQESGIYDVTIDLVYRQSTASGSEKMVFTFKGDAPNPFVFTNPFFTKSSTAKGNSNTFFNKRTNKEEYLPGYKQAAVISELTCNKKLDDLSWETKTVNLWSFEANKKVPTNVEVCEELIGKGLILGLTKLKENKRARGANNVWRNTNEPRWKNEIDKIFTDEGKTLTEHRNNLDPDFIVQWKGAKAGKDVDRFKPVAEEQPVPGVPAMPKPVEDTDSDPIFK
jgi:hypothetical protein